MQKVIHQVMGMQWSNDYRQGLMLRILILKDNPINAFEGQFCHEFCRRRALSTMKCFLDDRFMRGI